MNDIEKDLVIDEQEYELVQVNLGDGYHFTGITVTADDRYLFYDGIGSKLEYWEANRQFDTISAYKTVPGSQPYGVDQLWFIRKPVHDSNTPADDAMDVESPPRASTTSDGTSDDGDSKSFGTSDDGDSKSLPKGMANDCDSDVEVKERSGHGDDSTADDTMNVESPPESADFGDSVNAVTNSSVLEGDLKDKLKTIRNNLSNIIEDEQGAMLGHKEVYTKLK